MTSRTSWQTWLALPAIAGAGVLGCGKVADILTTNARPDSGAGGAMGGHHDDASTGQLDGGTPGDSSDASVDDVLRPHSGSRIKVRGYATPEGVALVASFWIDSSWGFRDSTRNVECLPTLASDGVTRCLPPPGGPSVWFTDAACTHPVIAQESVDPCAPAPRYALEGVTAKCPASGTAVYSIGSSIPAPTELYDNTAFGCDRVNPSTDNKYFEASPSPSTDWVGFDAKVKKVTSRLGVAYVTGSDGSLVLDGLRLLPEKVACEGTFITDQLERCVPKHRLSLGNQYFASDTCQGAPLGMTLDCAAPDLMEALEPSFVGPRCASPSLAGTLHRATRVESSAVFKGPGNCAPTPYGGFEYYAAGAAVPVTDYPVVETTHEGSGRIQQTYVTSEGKKLYATGLYDAQSKTDCMPTSLGTKMVCGTQFPTVYDVQGVIAATFADSKCSVLTYTPDLGDPCVPPAKLVVVAHDAAPVCGSALPSIHRLGALHTGPVYSGSTGSCSGPVPLASSAPTYDIGPAVDLLTVFAALTPVDL